MPHNPTVLAAQVALGENEIQQLQGQVRALQLSRHHLQQSLEAAGSEISRLQGELFRSKKAQELATFSADLFRIAAGTENPTVGPLSELLRRAAASLVPPGLDDPAERQALGRVLAHRADVLDMALGALDQAEGAANGKA